MTGKMPNRFVKDFNGINVLIVKFGSRGWGAQWLGSDGQLVRLDPRSSLAKLHLAIEGTMKLRGDHGSK